MNSTLSVKIEPGEFHLAGTSYFFPLTKIYELLLLIEFHRQTSKEIVFTFILVQWKWCCIGSSPSRPQPRIPNILTIDSPSDKCSFPRWDATSAGALPSKSHTLIDPVLSVAKRKW